jgi:hypothetical protein
VKTLSRQNVESLDHTYLRTYPVLCDRNGNALSLSNLQWQLRGKQWNRPENVRFVLRRRKIDVVTTRVCFNCCWYFGRGMSNKRFKNMDISQRWDICTFSLARNRLHCQASTFRGTRAQLTTLSNHDPTDQLRLYPKQTYIIYQLRRRSLRLPYYSIYVVARSHSCHTVVWGQPTFPSLRIGTFYHTYTWRGSLWLPRDFQNRSICLKKDWRELQRNVDRSKSQKELIQ